MTEHTLDLDRLPALVDAALAALSSDRAMLRLSVASRERPVTITMPPFSGGFTSPATDLLVWERFVDALPRAVERARLASMHEACGQAPPQAWSVYTTATTLAWLRMASGGAAGDRWDDNVAAILLAAESDGEVHLAGPDRSTMRGFLRSRRLDADITLSPRVGYRSTPGRMVSRDVIPDTVATASANRGVGELVEIPWLNDAGVRIARASTVSTGTVFVLDEDMVPLMPIPDAAMSAAPADRPAYAPWIVTSTERAALDEIDLDAHGAG